MRLMHGSIDEWLMIIVAKLRSDRSINWIV
uniref:Uncharacterized protein n=1 Tax=Musa acuminata subsp. malaccensis TaxID=214687 RepID=A0A804JY86_MUSAM